jgi:hypothetical protein
MRYALTIALGLLAGCATELNGNSRGGVIHWAGTTQGEVWQAASAHCAKYGKSVRITEFQARAGGRVVFDCI